MLSRVCKCGELFPAVKGAYRCDKCQRDKEARRKPRDKSAYQDKTYKANRAKLFIDPMASCAVPGCRNTDLTADHMDSLSNGGTHDLTNLLILCRKHNGEKTGKTLREYAAWLAGELPPDIPRA